MKPVLLVCLLSALACDVRAHRLDEYLQATRVAISTNRIELSIDLTPGVAVADQLLTHIDKNHDGLISKDEQKEYSKQFLRDITLKLDGKALPVNLAETLFPTPFEIKNGVGVLRISATAPVEPLAAGKHTLSITNAHLPTISVYLVNALMPKDPAIQITKQTRDESQKDYRLDFEVIATQP